MASSKGYGPAGSKGEYVTAHVQPWLCDVAEFFKVNYRLGRKVGCGSFGTVKIAEHVLTGHKVAVKIISKRDVASKDKGWHEKLRREIQVLALMRHPHVMRVWEVMETHKELYIVSEYIEGGELFDYITAVGRLPEAEARRLFQQIIAGVSYCHSRGVAHRDLKPENLMLDREGRVKLIDFGLANVMREGAPLKTSCGSFNYAAPEVIKGERYCGPEVDVWSCGVVLYALLCGTLPFNDDMQQGIPHVLRRIMAGQYASPPWLSPGSRDLMQRMMQVDPLKRVTIPEIRQHPWFRYQLPKYLRLMEQDASEGHIGTGGTSGMPLDPQALGQAEALGFPRDLVELSVLECTAGGSGSGDGAAAAPTDTSTAPGSSGSVASRATETNTAPGGGSVAARVTYELLADAAAARRDAARRELEEEGEEDEMAMDHDGGSNALASLQAAAGVPPSTWQQRQRCARVHRLGVSSSSAAAPSAAAVMGEVLRVLAGAGVRWKLTGRYCIRCLHLSPPIAIRAPSASAHLMATKGCGLSLTAVATADIHADARAPPGVEFYCPNIHASALNPCPDIHVDVGMPSPGDQLYCPPVAPPPITAASTAVHCAYSAPQQQQWAQQPPARVAASFTDAGRSNAGAGHAAAAALSRGGGDGGENEVRFEVQVWRSREGGRNSGRTGTAGGSDNGAGSSGNGAAAGQYRYVVDFRHLRGGVARALDLFADLSSAMRI